MSKKIDIEAAIRSAKSKAFPRMAQFGDAQWKVDRHDQASFIAGMREAARIANDERLEEPQEGTSDEAYELAIGHVVSAIMRQADDLDKPPETAA